MLINFCTTSYSLDSETRAQFVIVSVVISDFLCVKSVTVIMSAAFSKVKAVVDDARGHKHAEPIALALKTTGKIISSLPPFPGRSLLSGAFTLGGSVLNPDPSLADIKRSEESIKDEIKRNFSEIVEEMKSENAK